MDPLQTVDALYYSGCGLNANYQHLRHWTEGYLSMVRGEAGKHGCPYSPGSAREVSWSMGVEQARVDLGSRPRDLPIVQLHQEVTALLRDADASEDPSWRAIYDAVFSRRKALNVEIDYYDPDTSYEEDVRAFACALAEAVAPFLVLAGIEK